MPANISEIRERLIRPRPSLSPSVFNDASFEDFQDKDRRVISEASVMTGILPLLQGNNDFESAHNLLFTNLKPLTPDAPRPKPDLYDGCLPGDIEKPVLDKLDQSIVPTKHSTAPVAPNFFVQVKGPLGVPHEARLQVSNDLAAGARAMHALQNHDQQLSFDGNAYALGVTYQAGTSAMHVYSGHTVPFAADTEIHVSQVRGMILTDSPESCRQGITLFRNARDLTKEWRDGFTQQANSRSCGPDEEPTTRVQDVSYDEPLDCQEEVPHSVDERVAPQAKRKHEKSGGKSTRRRRC